MSTQYNRISLKYQIITLVLAVGSAIVVFVPIKQFKPFKSFASYLMIASKVCFVTTRHMMRDVLDEAEKLERENEENTDKLQRKIINITDEKSELIEKIVKLNDEIEALKFDSAEQLAELATCQQAIQQAKNDFTEFNYHSAHTIVENCYQVAMRKCVCHVDALYRQYPEYQAELDKIKLEIEAKKERFTDKITAYNSVVDMADLIDEGLALQELMIVQCIELRCKAQAIIIKHLKGAVPFAIYEEELESLAQLANTEITAAQQKRKEDLQSIIQEFTVIIDNHKANYINDVNDSIETAKLAVRKLEVTQSELQDALEQLAETKKPVHLPGGFSVALMANSINDYYYNRYRILLDAQMWEETETGIKIYYTIHRNPGLTESELSADNSLEQIASFCSALKGTTPVWEFNRQFNQLSLTVVHRRATKVKSGDELPRGVKTPKKFVETVKNWRRVRITGGSESGKSPTAENVICAILSQTIGTCDFYDPMFESVKNFRTIPAIGHTHANSVQGLKDYQAKMQLTPSDTLYFAWFDEIDSTLEENPKSASDLKAVLKQSSHKNSGLIITGQNANVKGLKHFDRSDMNNFVCVHIGDNFRDAIANSNLSDPEKTSLMKTGDALTEYCQTKNEELGFEPSDPATYRFALVLEPGNKRYFMLLPEFGQFVWSDIIQPTEATEAIDTDEPTEATDAASVTVSKKNPNCPDCGTDTRKNGFLKTSTERLQRYKCKNSECGREFV